MRTSISYFSKKVVFESSNNIVVPSIPTCILRDIVITDRFNNTKREFLKITFGLAHHISYVLKLFKN